MRYNSKKRATRRIYLAKVGGAIAAAPHSIKFTQKPQKNPSDPTDHVREGGNKSAQFQIGRRMKSCHSRCGCGRLLELKNDMSNNTTIGHACLASYRSDESQSG